MTVFTEANFYMVLSIFAMSLFQGKKNRTAAIAYGAVLILACLISMVLDSYQYFLFCALADCLVIFILCFFARPTKLCDVLVSLSLVSFLANALGAIAWFLSAPLDMYYLAHSTIYTVAILSLLPEGYVYDTNAGFLPGVFRFIGYPGHALRRVLRKEARA